MDTPDRKDSQGPGQPEHDAPPQHPHMEYAFVHNCGFPAFLYAEWPPQGGGLESAKALLLNGEKPKYQSQMRCGHCNEIINVISYQPKPMRVNLVLIDQLTPEQRSVLPEPYR